MIFSKIIVIVQLRQKHGSVLIYRSFALVTIVTDVGNKNFCFLSTHVEIRLLNCMFNNNVFYSSSNQHICCRFDLFNLYHWTSARWLVETSQNCIVSSQNIKNIFLKLYEQVKEYHAIQRTSLPGKSHALIHIITFTYSCVLLLPTYVCVPATFVKLCSFTSS